MKTPQQRYEEAMERLDDRFADGRLNDEFVAAIEAAVAEERERCAKIADDHILDGDGDYGMGNDNCAIRIADEIRKRSD